jgi:hypothetical protein
MSIYEFECEHGHVTEGHYALADRPAFIVCEHADLPGEPGSPMCGLAAHYVMSATPTSFRHSDRKAFKRQGH